MDDILRLSCLEDGGEEVVIVLFQLLLVAGIVGEAWSLGPLARLVALVGLVGFLVLNRLRGVQPDRWSVPGDRDGSFGGPMSRLKAIHLLLVIPASAAAFVILLRPLIDSWSFLAEPFYAALLSGTLLLAMGVQQLVVARRNHLRSRFGRDA